MTSNNPDSNENDALRALLARRPRGLMTDIDGTISPIAATPEAARVSDDAREQLRILAQRLDCVAAISGRSASDAAAMVGIPHMQYIGNHGLEVWRDGVAEPIAEARPYAAAVGAVLRVAQEQLTLPGILVEHKGVTGSIHYRQAADPAAAEAAIAAVLQSLANAHGLRLTQGRMVWELRPPLEVNKGTAVRRLVSQYKLKSVIFLGDDRTDADAFTVLRELRQRGECVTISVGVLAPETPSIVRELADVLVEGVSGVERWLAHVVNMTSA